MPERNARPRPSRLTCILLFLFVCILAGLCSRSCGFSGDVTLHKSTAATAEPYLVTPSPSAVPIAACTITATAVPTSTSVPEAMPEPISGVYILNTNSMRFHRPKCNSVPRISEKNRLDYTGPREALLEQGYIPCGNCHP